MLHRIFTAINIPEMIKKRFLDIRKDYSDLPAKWIDEENIHITLNFLGNVNDNQLNDVLKKTKEIGEKYEPFVVSFDKILYDSPNRFPPRMVWAKIQEDKDLMSLQKDLEDQLFSLESFRFKISEKRKFHPHITLARIKSFAFRKLVNPVDINMPLNLNFEVCSFEIIESQLKREGPEYTVIESIIL
jgi:RNA 2',3'-cyclic 3'-phosphodiesterase